MTKILIIEDEAILRGEVAEWLTLEGYETVTASDGVEGVDVALRELPDLIVCDITMPRLDGYGVLVELRSNMLTMNTAFIFLTARAAHDDIRRGMSLGADDYVTKPFTRIELLQAIHTRLDKKARQQQEFQEQLAVLEQVASQEREQRLLKAKLIAMFSHDFRNPLAGIMTSHALLRDYADKLDANRRRMHLDRIEAYVNQLVQMMDDMMTIAKIETGSLIFKPEPIQLNQYFERIVYDFQTMHSATHVLQLDNRLPQMVKADPQLIRQITANLISNAVKYSPQGGDVHIRAFHSNGVCTIEVQDHGIGILEADQARLFQAFQRGSNVNTIAGTGLGLAIVKQAVDLHKGSISLKSEVNKGTTMIASFTVEPC